MVHSLLLMCRACGVEPYEYLLHVLTELPRRTSDADITGLLPFKLGKPGNESAAARGTGANASL